MYNFMNSEGYPWWLRAIDIVIGLAIIIVSLWIVIDTSLAQRAIVLSLAFALLALGIIRFAKSVFMSELETVSRMTKGAVGLAAVILSMAVVLFPDLAITFVVTLVTFGIMLTGISRLVVGYMEKDMASWARVLYILGGMITFGFGFVAAIFPGLGFFTLILLLSAAMITLGVIRIVSGATGELR
ncbi:MAG: hypothetical protein EAX95_10695 [Candidatus Thorarchaeota archaeon]|nr:hypothetical protein [Candidatus Thorarchaeota archaeon]